jgi:uroporphyrinogen decarboxylase
MMNDRYNHRQRLEMCLSGEKPDRVPVALWRHFPVDDQSPDGLAAATAGFQRQFDFDLIKVTPASSFCVKDWGVQDEWQGNPEGTRAYTHYPVQTPEDWTRLSLLDPTTGYLGNQLKTLELLINGFSPETPIIQTIFNPLSQAKNLVGRDNLNLHIRRFPDALHAGLETITQTTLRFLGEAVRLGIDGVFFAIQHAQYGLNTREEYETFGKAYDLRILEETSSLWLNIAHIHGEEIMFDLVADYPVQILNWHDRQTEPSLAGAGAKFPGALCGGLRQWETMVLGSPSQVIAEAEDAIRATGGRKFILGTGCVVPVTAPHGNILAARQVVDAQTQV